MSKSNKKWYLNYAPHAVYANPDAIAIFDNKPTVSMLKKTLIDVYEEEEKWIELEETLYSRFSDGDYEIHEVERENGVIKLP